jgi:hypothetical protein
MDDILSIMKMIATDGFTWQETIIVSLFIIGATLSVLIIIRGGVSLFSLFLRTVDNAISKMQYVARSRKEDLKQE